MADVGVEFTVVPDGVAFDATRRICRISVAAMPLAPMIGQGFALASWPSEIATRIKAQLASGGFWIKVRPDPLGGNPQTADGVAIAGVRFAGPTNLGDGLWQRLFGGTLEHLLDALKQDNSQPKAISQVASIQAGAFADAIDRLYANTALRSLVRASAGAAAAPGGASNDPFRSAASLDFWRSLGEPRGDGRRAAEANAALARMVAAAAHPAGQPPSEAPVGAVDQAGRELAVHGGLAASLNARIAALDGFGADPSAIGFAVDRPVGAWNMSAVRSSLADYRSRWGAPAEGATRAAAAGSAGVDSDSEWDPATEDEQPPAIARRKLAGILSYPTLAKYLGLIVDFEFAFENLRVAMGWPPGAETDAARRLGAITTGFTGSPPQKWTALVWATVPSGYFGPCAKGEAESSPDESLYRDGILNLGIDGGTRFRLSSLDHERMAFALSHRRDAILAADRAGVPLGQQSLKLPEQQRGGIMLVDGKATECLAPTLPGTVLFAEDLGVGYRADMAIAHRDRPDDWKQSERWRSLMDRDIRFDDIPEQFLNDPDVAARAARDHGHARVTCAHQKDPHAPDKEIVTPTAELFRWNGDSLGVSAPDQSPGSGAGRRRAEDPAYSVPLDPAKDLAVNITIGLPRNGKPLLPLRDGYLYMAGCRICFVNGCSVELGDAVRRYAVEPHLTLGKSAGVPLPYGPREEVAAPDLLIPEEAPLVTKASNALFGETLDHLVVRSRSSSVPTARVQRYLIPGRKGFADAEQAGLFDGDDHDEDMKPAGALASFMRLSATYGDFPIAVNGRWREISEDGGPAQSEASRGPVAVFRASSNEPGAPFYPDPLAKNVQIAFVRDAAAEPYVEGPQAPSRFWDGEDPFEAEPVLLELVAANPSGQKRAWFLPKRTATVNVPGGRPRRFTHLRVALAPAERAELMIWSFPDGQRALEHQVVAGALESLTGASTRMPAMVAAAGAPLNPRVSRALRRLRSPAGNNAITDLMATTCLPNVTMCRTAQLVHAVERPLKPPAFVAQGQGIRLHAVAIRIRPDSSGDGEEGKTRLRSWQDYVDNQTCTDNQKWASEEGGSIVFFTGTFTGDRASTGNMRCEAEWVEHGSDALVEQGGRWRYQPATLRQQLFKLRDIAVPTGPRSDEVAVLSDDLGQLRPNGVLFADGRARRLRVNLVATSRFSSYFPGGEPNAAGEVDDRFERKSVGGGEIIVASTYRPARVSVDRIIPLFKVNRQRNGRRLTIKRECWLRIYCDADWPSTGADEALAVVCAQTEIADDNRLAPFVSRAGRDPIHRSTDSGSWLKPDRFKDRAGRPAVARANLPLRLGEDWPAAAARPGCIADIPQTPLEADKVSIAILAERLLDREEGRWYIDLKIDSGDAYFPFVRLALSRYQPHAASPELLLSEPVAAWAQLPPYREAVVTVTGRRSFEVRVEGIGFQDPVAGRDSAEAAVPLLNIRLLQAVVHEPGSLEPNDWVPVPDTPDKPTYLKHRRPDRIEGNKLFWTCRMAFPRPWPESHYAVLIEEVELAAAEVAEMNLAACAPDQAHIETIERGPYFSEIIDFDPTQWSSPFPFGQR